MWLVFLQFWVSWSLGLDFDDLVLIHLYDSYTACTKVTGDNRGLRRPLKRGLS